MILFTFSIYCIKQKMLIVTIYRSIIQKYNIKQTAVRNSQKMSTSIPNVSSIYRDLSHLCNSTSYMNNKSPASYSLDPQIATGATTSAHEDLYQYKQKRHNQLMARLKNSCEEHQELVGVLGGNLGAGYGGSTSGWDRKDNYATNRSYQTQNYNQGNTYGNSNQNSYLSMSMSANNNSNSNMNTSNRLQSSGYVIPKIKYRHIEDHKQKNDRMQYSSNNNNNNMASFGKNKGGDLQQLQKQFYDDAGSKIIGQQKQQQQQPNQKNNNGRSYLSMDTQTKNIKAEPDWDQKSQISNKTNTFGKSNKNHQYADKLESYYELCRKNLGAKNSQIQKPKQKQEKFVRATGAKNKAMKLDQAIKLLSLD